MKRKRFIAALLLIVISGVTQNSFAESTPTTPVLEPKGERAVIDDIPSNHWAPYCVGRLIYLLGLPPSMTGNRPVYDRQGLTWTRYEFAIFCVRMNQEYSPLNDPTAKDILYTLNQEFAVEIARLGGGELVNPNILASRVAPPPRLIIPPSIGKPGYNGYVGRKFLSPKELENIQKEAEKTEVPAK